MIFQRSGSGKRDDPRGDGSGADNSGPGNVRRALPLLPLRDIVLFPHMVVPLFVGRPRSVRALEAAMEGSKDIFLAAQKKAKTKDPAPEDIFRTGTLGTIVQLLRLSDGTVKVLVEGKKRIRVESFLPKEGYFYCEGTTVDEPVVEALECEALMRSVQDSFEGYARLNKRIPPEMVLTVRTVEDPSRLADTVVVHLSSLKLRDRQEVLEILHPLRRLERLLALMNTEIEILQVERRIRSRVKKQMERSQKEYYLNEQMQAIQKELGERDENRSELDSLAELLEQKALPDGAKAKALGELKKLKMMQPISAEATVVRNYLDWVLHLPWGHHNAVQTDLKDAMEVLETDHHGLERVKDRVLEHLAVQTLVRKSQGTDGPGPVLCLVGPPGVGKTSLARSIARATGRAFVRLSLGGVRDEAEIRGHRRTYIGAMPGRLVQSLRRAGSDNPVFLLDEIDKMASDFRGDPAAALLEVLDPEQNNAFHDHFLDMDYDLSKVMFITTANSLKGIPLPLRDRMEIVELSGYTDIEKEVIGHTYLIPRQLEKSGLTGQDVEIQEGTVRSLIRSYTRESGVRSLERRIGELFRKFARLRLERGDSDPFTVAPGDLETYLGPAKFRLEQTGDRDEVGLTTGLAYTQTGGTTLECEVSVVPGKGKLVITGLLEKGMQESAQAAMSYVRSRQRSLGLDDGFYQDNDFHIHFPEFVPKDGPSAGITMATSLASALMRIPVRKNVAMTGEITLGGRVLPVGGLKEKLLAAVRAGVETVLVPQDNEKDLKEVPQEVFGSLRVVLVRHMDAVLREALRLNDPEALLGHGEDAVEYPGEDAVAYPENPVDGPPGPPSPQ